MKKVLIITYYWPPSGGGGVQRWLKFSKYLPEHGVIPIVVSPKGAEYPVIDESLESSIPSEVEHVLIPIWEPYKLFKKFTGKDKSTKVNSGVLKDRSKQSFKEKLSLWIRGNVLIPDPRVFWVRPGHQKLRRYLKENHVDTIVTTGPPHSVHLIGLKLKNEFGIRWIADFRDPWSEIDYLDEFNLTLVARRVHEKLERKVLKKADTVLTVSHNWASDLERLGANDVQVITNGYDEDDFKDFDYDYKSDKFVILYSGILTEYRNPERLWKVLDELCASNRQFADQLELRFYGTIDQGVIDSIKKLSFLGQRYSYGGYIDHEKLLKAYEKASLLLLLQNDTKNAMGHIPGKVFEYLATEKPILALAKKESDVGKIIEEAGAGEVCSSDNDRRMFDVIQAMYYCWSEQNTKAEHVSRNNKYTRKELTKALVKQI